MARAWFGLTATREFEDMEQAEAAFPEWEKALKAIHYLSGERLVTGHSLVELLETAAEPTGTLARLLDSARQLDQYYIPSRYPNGLPGGIPAEIFTDSQAEDAVNRARAFIEVAHAAISGCCCLRTSWSAAR